MEQTSGNVVWADLGVLVLLYIPATTSDATASNGSIIMDTPFPVSLRPSSARSVSGSAVSGGSTVDATFVIGTDGSVTVTTEGDFATTGTNGLVFQGLSYMK